MPKKKILQKEMQRDIKNDYVTSEKRHQKIKPEKINSFKSVDDLLKKEKNTALEANEDTATYYTEKQRTAEQRQYESQQVQQKVTRDTFLKIIKSLDKYFILIG